MFANFRTWLDHRTGYKKLLEVLLLEEIPGGDKWRYVWGSCLAFVFAVQLITGLLLMTAYSPGDTSAWGSVYFIQYEMEFGWLIRGLHHFGSQAMVVLLGLHMLQVVIAGAHLPPREINWWLGLALMGAILGLSLTGYLLPWDQKGFWATQVATSIAGNIPGIGSFVKRILVGGPEYGNHTLTRFYALHVGVLPAAVVVLLFMHIAIFRRHGVTAPKDAEGEVMFWPDQAFKDLLACLAIFGLLLGMVVFGAQGNVQQRQEGAAAPEQSLYEQLAYGGRDGRGANLDAPADPQEQYPARPEWYFLFLFQLLKYFEGDQILVGTVLIPNGVGLLLFLLPLFGYGRMRPFGHIFGVVVVVAVLTAAASLTCLAIADDSPDPITRSALEHLAFLHMPFNSGVLLILLGLLAILPKGGFRRLVFGLGVVILTILVGGTGAAVYATVTDNLPKGMREHLAEHVRETEDNPSEMTKKAKGFRKQVQHAEINAERAVQIAHRGIPDGGAALLLQRDPMTAGKTLFVQKCGVCHSYQGVCEGDKFTASELKNFGTKEWIRGLLRAPDDPHYFGRTSLKGGTMSKWVATTRAVSEDKLKQVEEDFDNIAAWLGSQPTRLPKAGDPPAFAAGQAAFEKQCNRCHTFAGKGGRSEASLGPDLTGYGSADWIRLMIMAPDSPLRYGRDNRNTMTVYRDLLGSSGDVTKEDLKRVQELLLKKLEDADPDSPKTKAEREKILQSAPVSHLSDIERELIIRFLVHDDRVVFFGRPVSGPEEKPKTK